MTTDAGAYSDDVTAVQLAAADGVIFRPVEVTTDRVDGQAAAVIARRDDLLVVAAVSRRAADGAARAGACALWLHPVDAPG